MKMGDVGGEMTTMSNAEINRYSISLKDFEKAKECVAQAKKHKDGSLEWDALYFMAIVSYCRPFGPNEKPLKAGAEPAKAVPRISFQSLKVDSPELKAAHESLMELRHTALAHSSWEKYPTSFNEATSVYQSRTFTIYGSGAPLHELELLVDRGIEICHNVKADYSFGRNG